MYIVLKASLMGRAIRESQEVVHFEKMFDLQ